MNWTSHPDPKRKSNQYSGGNFLDGLDFSNLRVSKWDSYESAKSDGANAIKNCYHDALEGIQNANELSCLRGELRKAMITLAQEINRSDNIMILPAKRKQMNLDAVKKFWAVIAGNDLVSDIKNGQKIWRLKPLTTAKKYQTESQSVSSEPYSKLGPRTADEIRTRLLALGSEGRKLNEYVEAILAKRTTFGFIELYLVGSKWVDEGFESCPVEYFGDKAKMRFVKKDKNGVIEEQRTVHFTRQSQS